MRRYVIALEAGLLISGLVLTALLLTGTIGCARAGGDPTPSGADCSGLTGCRVGGAKFVEPPSAMPPPTMMAELGRVAPTVVDESGGRLPDAPAYGPVKHKVTAGPPGAEPRADAHHRPPVARSIESDPVARSLVVEVNGAGGESTRLRLMPEVPMVVDGHRYELMMATARPLPGAVRFSVDVAIDGQVHELAFDGEDRCGGGTAHEIGKPRGPNHQEGAYVFAPPLPDPIGPGVTLARVEFAGM